MESKKSHSWWWDSHASSKNSKWLADNLENMDQSVKRMLNLIEEDADSFGKRAEMYYKKRPLLVTHVEEFYRMYRSLAARYDHVTGDFGSEPPSSWPSPEPKPSRHKSGPRAAGYEFFLGSCGIDDDASATSDSASESDDSSVNGEEEHLALCRKIIELEVELRHEKEKVCATVEELMAREEKLQVSEREIAFLRHERESSGSLEEEIRRVKAAKAEAEDLLRAEMEQLKVEHKLELETLTMEKDGLNAKTAFLLGEVSSRDDQIEQLKQLHIEHVELISSGTETGHRQLEEVRSRVQELEEEVEKQREVISEEKSEAIW